MAGMAGRRVGKLTARQVETMRKPGLHGDGGNLYLKVDDGGSKSWMFRHQVSGKVRKYGLGPTHTVSLIDARERAEAIRRQLLDGIDPRKPGVPRGAAAVAEAKSISFDDATEAYIESHRAGWKSDKHAAPMAGDARDLRQPGIRQAAGDRHRHRHGDAGAEAALGHQERDGAQGPRPHRGGAVVGKVHGYRSGENPAQWRDHLDHLLPARAKVHKVEHHAALPYDQLPDFMRDLRERDGIAATGAGIHHPVRDQNQRDAERGMVRVRPRQQALDHPARAHEGRSRASRSAV